MTGPAPVRVAVIGMAGRFPGAPDVETFWANLCAGRESIRRFSPDELDPSIPPAHRTDPAYVPARGVIDGVELFDAGFFGISPLEAQLLDPQHRHFLEVSWQAFEHAGYVPETAPGPIGIFGGMYNASYFQRHLVPRPDVAGRLGELALLLVTTGRTNGGSQRWITYLMYFISFCFLITLPFRLLVGPIDPNANPTPQVTEPGLYTRSVPEMKNPTD